MTKTIEINFDGEEKRVVWYQGCKTTTTCTRDSSRRLDIIYLRYLIITLYHIQFLPPVASQLPLLIYTSIYLLCDLLLKFK